MKKSTEKVSQALLENQVENPNGASSDEKLRILSDIASRQKQLKRRKNIISNVILMVASLVLTTVLSFALVFLFANKTHKVSFYIDNKVVKTMEIKDESIIDEFSIPDVDEKAYEFDGFWYTNPYLLGTPYDFNKPVTKKLKLYAGATLRTVTLRVHLNDKDEAEKYYEYEGKYNTLVNVINNAFIIENLSDEYKNNYNLVGFDRDPAAFEPEFSTDDEVGLFEGDLYAIWRGRRINVVLSGVGAQVIGGGKFQGETLSLYYGATYTVDIDKYLTTVCEDGTGSRVDGLRVITEDGEKVYKNGESFVIGDDMQFELAFVEGEINRLVLDFNNGDAGQVYYGVQPVKLPNASNPHHVLEGYNGEEGTLPVGAEIIVRGDITYTSKWQSIVYKILLNTNGATNDCTTEFFQKYDVGFYHDEQTQDSLTKIVTPIKEGYIFNGYYVRIGSEDVLVINAIGEFEEYIDAKTFKGNITLNARYTLITHAVIIDNSGEYGTITPQSSNIVDHGRAFRFRVTLKPEYAQNYENLLTMLQEQYTVYQVTPGAINQHTIFEITNITSDISLSIPSIITVNKYNITWANWDGTVVATTQCEHGSLPAFPEDIDKPVRDSEGEISFSFTGWDRPITQAVTDQIYNARYKGIVERPVVTGELIYNGTPQLPNIQTSNYYQILVNAQIDAGKYTGMNAARVVLRAQAGLSHMEWVGGSTSELLLDWEIQTTTIEAPTVDGKTTFAYNGREQQVEISAYDTRFIRVTGNRGTDVNTYVGSISLIDSKNYTWEDGETASKVFAWEITPATLTITVKDVTKIYDGLRYEYNGDPKTSEDLIFEGFMGDDNEKSGAITGVFSFTGEAYTATSVGVYSIILVDDSVTAKNYNITLVRGTLTITQKTDVEKPTLLENAFEYSGENIDITDSFDELFSADIMTLSGDVVKKDAGEYTVIVTLNRNYTWSDGEDNSFNLTWSIKKTTLTITAENKEKIFGEANPRLTFTHVGLKDNESVLDAIELTTAASTDSNVGVYDITLYGTPHLSNYDIIFNKGTLTIHVLEIQAPTATNTVLEYNGFIQQLEVEGFNTTSMNITGNYGTSAGDYQAVITLKNDNYRWIALGTQPINIDWMITKATLGLPTVEGERDFEYTGSPHGLTFTPQEIGDETKYIISSNSEINVGIYSAVVSLFDANNYIWADGAEDPLTFEWSIYAKKLAVPEIDEENTFEYNGETQEVSLTEYDSSLINITGNTAKDAGEHIIIISLIDTLNFSWEDGGTANKTITWNITQTQLVVEVVDASVEYGDEIPEFELVFTTFKGTDTEQNSITGTFSVTTTATAGTNVGQYEINLQEGSAQSTNYSFVLYGGTLTITEKGGIVKPTLINDSFVYTGGNIIPELADFDGAIMQISGTQSAKDVGTYTITITLDNNHAWADEGEKSFDLSWSITKATLTITADNKTRIYKETNPVFTYIVSGFLGTDNESVIMGDITLTTVADENSSVEGSPYAISIENNLTADNYNIELVEGELNITHKKLTKPVIDGVSVFEYDGNAKTLQFAGFDSDAMNLVGNIATSAGKHVATISLKDKSNYRWADETNEDISFEYWIEEAVLAKPYVESTLVYNKTSQRPIILPTNAGDEDYYEVVVENKTDVGVYTATVSLTSPNYVWDDGSSDDLILEWEITPARLTMPTARGAVQFEYNGVEQTLQLNDFDAVNLEIVDNSNQATNVGDYETVITIVDKHNYTWDNAEFTTDNIVISWKITKATLVVTANNKTITYGDDLPTFDVSYSGFLQDDNKDNSIVGDFAFEGSATTVTKTSNIGEYDIIISSQLPTSQNYNFEINNGKLTIIAKGGIVKPTLEFIEYEYLGEDIDILEKLVDYNNAIMAVSGNTVERNVGSYTITITLDNNHEWADESAKSFTISWDITPTTLTITVDNKVKNYGEENPELTFKYDGLKDDISILDVFVLETEATKESNVGIYEIDLTGSPKLTNYEINFISGTLEIKPLQVAKPTAAVVTLVYTGDEQELQLQGFSYASMTKTGYLGTNAGGYKAIIKLISSNFTWSDGTTETVEIDWHITKKIVGLPTVQGETSFEYDSTVHGLTIVPSVAGEEELYTISGNAGTTVGYYSTIVSLNDASNFMWDNDELNPISFAWNIYAKKLAVPYATGGTTFSYNGKEQTLSLSAYDSNLIQAEGNKKTNAGNYTVVLSLIDSSNYTWLDNSTANQTLDWAITKIQLNVKVKNLTMTFNGAPYSFNGNPQNTTDLIFEGFVEGDNKNNAIIGVFAFAGEALTAVDSGIYTVDVLEGDAKSTNYFFVFESGQLEITALGGITKPTLKQDEFIYIGGNIQPELLNFIETILDNEAMSIIEGSELIAKDANTALKPYYSIVISLGDSFTWIAEDEEPNNDPIEIKWRILPAQLMVKANNVSRVYKEDNPAPLTYEVLGLLGNDEASIITSVTFGAEALSAINVGDYNIEIVDHTTTSTNYEVSYDSGLLIITHALLDKPIVPEQTISFVYSGSAYTVEKTTFEGFSDESMTIEGNTGTNVGHYTVIISLKDNYAWAGGAPTFDKIYVDWYITKQIVNKPVVGGEILVYNTLPQSPNITTNPLYTITNNVQTNAGLYYATVALKSPENYMWQGAEQSSAPLSLEWRIHKAELQQPAISSENSLVYTSTQQELVISNYDDKLITVTGNKQTNVGDYTAVISINNTANYTWAGGSTSNITADWYIIKALLVVTANDQTAVFLDEFPEFTVRYSGFLGGDNEGNSITGNFSLTANASVGSVVGSYTITAQKGSAQSANYDFTFVNGMLTITPLADIEKPTLEISSFTYTGGNITPNILNLRPAIMEITGDTVAKNARAQNYVITIKLDENYSWAGEEFSDNTVELNWIITKANLTVSAENKTKVYGSANPTLTYVVSGLLGTDSESVILGGISLTTPALTNSAVGMYDITFVNALTANNYVVEVNNATLEITHKVIAKPSITGATSFVYDGYVKSLSMSGFDSATMNRTGYTATNAGLYTATISLKDITNYRWSDGSILNITQDWQITKAVVTKPTASGSLTYNGNPQSPTIATSPHYTISGNVGTNANTYFATVALKDKANYTWNDGSITDLSLEWTINRAKITAPTVKSATYVYNGANQTLQLDNFNSTTMNISGNVYKNAYENYVATISLKDTVNFTWNDGTNLALEYYWTINKAQLTVRANAKTMVFGSERPPFDVTIEGFMPGDNADNSITGNFSFIGSATFVTPTSNVGEYDIAISTTLPASTNYNFTLVNSKLTITPLGGIVKPTLKVSSVAYTGYDIDMRANVNDFRSDIMTITNDVRRNSGTHTIIITLDNNHTWSDGGSRTINLPWNITKVNLTITADNKTKVYGTANPSLTYKISGLKGLDSESVIIGTFPLSTSATTNSNVGSYPITIGGSPTATNYNIVKVNGSLSITHKLITKPTAAVTSFTYDGTQKSVGVNGFDSATMNVSGNTGTNANSYTAVYSLKTANYKWADGTTSNISIPWTIKKATIAKPTISGATSFVYNGSAHSPVIATNSLYTISGNVATNAGSYNAIITIIDKTNYSWSDGTISNLSLPWKITPKLLTIPTASVTSFVYSAANRTLSLTGFDSGTMAVSGNTYKNAGSYSAVISLKNTSNYRWSDGTSSNKTIAWTITKAPLTVTANNKTKVYGAALPSFDVSYSAFKGTDTAGTAITGSFSLTTTATASSNVGVYNIVLGMGSAASANYAITLVNGKLTITEKGGVAKPTLVANSFTYTGSTITPEISGLNLSIMQRTGSTSARNVGTYTITITLDNNHAWSGGGAKSFNLSWEIKPANLVVTAQNKSKVYGTANPAFTYTVATLLGGDTINDVFSNFKLSSPAGTSDNVGSYDINIEGTQISNNYNVTRVKGTLTITHKLLTKPTATTTSFTYDGSAKSVGVSGYDSATMNRSGYSATNAGSYTAVYSLKTTNYKWADGTTANVSIGWVINKAKIAKPTASGSRTYNGAAQSPTIPTSSLYTISGNVATNAGSYTAKVVINNKTNYCWTDGTTTDLSLSWSIAKFTPTMNAQTGTYAYIYGQLLNAKTITETARGVSGNIAGTFAFVSPTQKPSTSTTSVQIRFTPTDTTNYNTNTFNLAISVTQVGISFVSNGGTAVAKINGEYNQAIAKPTNPTRSHYTFAGWYTTSALTTAVTWPHTLRSNVTFYAKWTPIKYTVTFSTSTTNGTGAVKYPNNSNAVTIPSASINYGSSYSFNLNSAPFAGLYRKSNGAVITGLQIGGTGTVYTSTISVTGNITVTFVFSSTANTAIINYNGGSTTGTGTAQGNSTYYGKGTNLSAVDVKKEFYILKGYATQNVAWNNGNLGGTIPLYTRAQVNGRQVGAGTVTYYAIWEPILVRFTYNANGGSGAASGGASAKYGTSSFALASRGTLARTYYTFTGWAKTSGAAKTHNAGAAIALNSTLLKDSSYTKSAYAIGNAEITITLYANWSRNQTTITFNYGSGTGSPTSKVFDSGSSINTATALAPTSWSRAGYKFDGWSTSSGGAKLAATWTVPTSATTLYARWVALSYTVTLNKNSGSGGTSSVTATYGSNMPSATAPTRTGYTFAGYYDATSGGTQYYTSAMASARTWNKAANTTLYARWTARTFTVTLNENGGTGGTSSVTATYGSNMPSASAPTRTGYNFAGYYDATSGGTQYYTSAMASARTWNKTANTTLYARWTARTFTVTLNKNGGTGGTSSVTATYASNMPSATAPTRANHTFQGYYDATSGGTQYYTSSMASAQTWNKTANTTLYARWVGSTYTVTKEALPIAETIVSVGSSTGVITTNSTGRTFAIISPATQKVTIKTVRNSGNPALYLLNADKCYLAWKGGGFLTFNATIEYTLSANTVYYFVVYSQSASVTTNTNVTGSTTGTGTRPGRSTQSVQLSASYNLGTPTRTGYTFSGWYTAISGGTKIATSGTWSTAGNTTLYGRWSGNVYTITRNTQGGNSMAATTATYGSGFDFGKPTRSGYTFDGWYTAASGGTRLTNNTGKSPGTGRSSGKYYDPWKLTGNRTVYARWLVDEIYCSYCETYHEPPECY